MEYKGTKSIENNIQFVVGFVIKMVYGLGTLVLRPLIIGLVLYLSVIPIQSQSNESVHDDSLPMTTEPYLFFNEDELNAAEPKPGLIKQIFEKIWSKLEHLNFFKPTTQPSVVATTTTTTKTVVPDKKDNTSATEKPISDFLNDYPTS